jgi:hypothetical protein
MILLFFPLANSSKKNATDINVGNEMENELINLNLDLKLEINNGNLSDHGLRKREVLRRRDASNE